MKQWISANGFKTLDRCGLREISEVRFGLRIFLKTGIDKYIALRYATYIEVRCIELRYIIEKGEPLTAGQDVSIVKVKFWRESYEMEKHKAA